MTETLEEKIARVLKDQIDVSPYDPAWPARFEAEKTHIMECLPMEMIVRIEHFGSTAVPGLTAKPIVDVLVEVADLQQAKEIVPGVFEPQGYDYFWRPTMGDDTPPWYCWLIKRDAAGNRTHHIHIVEPDMKSRELRFRDMLRADAALAAAYGELKQNLAAQFPSDREAYTEGKTEFIQNAMGETPLDERE